MDPNYDEFIAQFAQAFPAGVDWQPLATQLGSCYQGRPYHNLRHIVQMMRFCAEAPIERRDLLTLAIAYHDAIYDPHAQDNEERSAAMAQQALQPLLSPDDLETVLGSIMATKRHEAPSAEDPIRRAHEAWIIDADLFGFVDNSDENARHIREEFCHVPASEWRAGRIEFLTRFEKRRPFFFAADHEATFGERARAAIRRQIAEQF